jgi:hypothetical protein
VKKIAGILAALALCGCGNSSVDGTLTGQVKKITNVTPMFCSPYTAVDVSMGVMRNGTGSMSVQDEWMTIGDRVDNVTIEMLDRAARDGSIIDVTFNTRRLPFCTEEYILTNAALSK